VLLDNFVPGSRFGDVVRLYVFDKKLRLLALDALERIEMAVRVDVAHLLGQLDPRAHEISACLHGNFAKKVITKGPDAGKTAHQAWLSKYQALLNRARGTPFVQHHLREYGTLPIWVAIEVWDFGLLSRLFAGMRYAEQQTVAAIYGAADGATFAQWLRSLNFIRNVAAHHSRLWNLNVVERSAVPADWPATLDNSRPFFYFCLMQHLLNVICPNSTWGQRVVSLLERDFPSTPNGGLRLGDLGCEAGWSQTKPWVTQVQK
jgi:abortive infection bacteriophage resistance protein